MTADYVSIAATLPAIYQEDPVSFSEIDSYLGLVDDLHRAYIARLDELAAWLSPTASVWPPGLPLDAGRDDVLLRFEELYDELASWVGFVFPSSWPAGAAGLERRRRFLLHVARLWRRRGTPRGFLDWFCLYFGIEDPARRPHLLEHFKFSEGGTAEVAGASTGLRATLLVSGGDPFRDVARRREASYFVDRYAPSHIYVRVCWVNPSQDLRLDPPAPYDDPDAWTAYRAHVRKLLCSLVDFTDHKVALHIGACIDDGRLEDRLDTGRLPSDGSS